MTSKKTILVNGVFDCLHIGHKRLLSYAKSLGDTLIVAIDSDARVAAMKGKDRPVNNSMVRSEFLDHIKGVSLVVEFGSDLELESWIKELQVDVLVVGEEYRNKKVVGSELVNELVFFPKVYGYSSTALIEKNHY